MTGPFASPAPEPGTPRGAHPERVPNRATGWSSKRLATKYPRTGLRGRPRGADDEARLTWDIDARVGTVRLQGGVQGLEGYTLPLSPMLGCLGVAPGRGQAISAATSAEHGGNMDYRGIGAGTTLYFPVFVSGGLFFLGDGHAVQGAGEMAGTGVETSFDVSFAVGLKKFDGSDRVHWPRGEDAHGLFTLGNARPLDQAHSTPLTGDDQSSCTVTGCRSRQLGDHRSGSGYEIGNMSTPAYTVVCRVPSEARP